MKMIKKGLREQARNKYRNLSEEDENKKREYERNRYIICLKKRNKNLKNIKKLLLD